MMIFKNTRRLAILTCLTFSFVGCGKPNIEHNCSTNGFGKVDCSFHNTGNAEGSICVKIKLLYTSEYTNLSSHYYPNGITSNKICSGIVKVDDVVERSQHGGFELSPSDYCDNGIGSWSSGCTLSVEQKASK